MTNISLRLVIIITTQNKMTMPNLIMNSSWLSIFIERLLLPITVAFIAYYVFGKRDEWKKRQKYSKLGIELFLILIEEVKMGHDILKHPFTKSCNKPVYLPDRCWHGIETIPDEILLRIMAISEKMPSTTNSPVRLRAQLKNYFEYLTKDYKSIYDKVCTEKPQGSDLAQFKVQVDELANYTSEILGSLVLTKDMLAKNSKKWFPK